MRKITSALNRGIPGTSITTTVLFLLMALDFGTLAAFRAIVAIFSLRMHRNGYLGAVCRLATSRSSGGTLPVAVMSLESFCGPIAFAVVVAKLTELMS